MSVFPRVCRERSMLAEVASSRLKVKINDCFTKEILSCAVMNANKDLKENNNLLESEAFLIWLSGGTCSVPGSGGCLINCALAAADSCMNLSATYFVVSSYCRSCTLGSLFTT